MTNFALVETDVKTQPKFDPNKTLPPGTVTYRELMDRMDEMILWPGMAASFAEELIDQLDRPEEWVATSYMKLDARPYENRGK